MDVIQVRKAAIRFLVIHSFLAHHCLLSAFKDNSGWYGKHHLSGLSTPLLTQPQTWHIFHMLWLCSCWAHTHCGITEFCAHGVPWALGWMGQPEMGADTCIAHFSSAHGHVSLYNQVSIIKRKFKDKIMKNFKMATEEYYTDLGPFWGQSLVMPLHRPHGQGLGPGPARNTLPIFQ